MILSEKYLYALLNELSAISEEVRVEYPPIGTLFTVKLGERCKIEILSEREYTTLREEFLRYETPGSVPTREIPERIDFRTCFYASSVLRSENQPELESLIWGGISRDLLKGVKPLFIGFDTNALSYRLSKLVEEIILHKSRGIKPQIGYCLSGGVREELHSILDKKYRSSEIEHLDLPNMKFTKNFLNQPPKDSRMAYLGALELKQILANPNCELVEGRKGDSNIISSYGSFERSHNVELLLITGDSIFASMAQNSRLHTLHMKLPGSLDHCMKIETDFKNVVELLFCTAIIFGHIRMQGIELYGIWKGKSAADWDACNLNVEVKNSTIRKNLLRDLKIIEMAKK